MKQKKTLIKQDKKFSRNYSIILSLPRHPAPQTPTHLRSQKLLPAWCEEEQDSLHGPRQSDDPDQQGQQHHVGEESGEIGGLAWALDALHHYHEQQGPRHQGRQGKAPVRKTQAV